MKIGNILLFVALILSSCHKDEKSERLNKFLKEYDNSMNNNIQVMIFIPLEGVCISCLDRILYFSKEHLGDERVLFVLSTRYKKIVASYFSENELTNKNIIHDNRLLSQKLQLVNTAPSIYLLKNKTVIKTYDLSIKEFTMDYDQLFNNSSMKGRKVMKELRIKNEGNEGEEELRMKE